MVFWRNSWNNSYSYDDFQFISYDVNLTANKLISINQKQLVACPLFWFTFTLLIRIWLPAALGNKSSYLPSTKLENYQSTLNLGFSPSLSLSRSSSMASFGCVPRHPFITSVSPEGLTCVCVKMCVSVCTRAQSSIDWRFFRTSFRFSWALISALYSRIECSAPPRKRHKSEHAKNSPPCTVQRKRKENCYDQIEQVGGLGLLMGFILGTISR